MNALLATVFVASLLGSPHCAGMCGGLVAFSAGAGGSPLAHHLGRALVYGTLGALAGAAGLAVNAGAGHPQVASLVAAMLMVAWASVSLIEAWGLAPPHFLVPRALQRLSFRASARVRTLPPLVRGLALGATSALIPCGWLYAFVLSAAGTGSATEGALSMLVFWAGTLPLLVGVGVVAQRLAGRARLWLPRWAPLVVLVVGISSVVVRWPTHGLTSAPLAADAAQECHGSGR